MEEEILCLYENCNAVFFIEIRLYSLRCTKKLASSSRVWSHAHLDVFWMSLLVCGDCGSSRSRCYRVSSSVPQSDCPWMIVLTSHIVLPNVDSGVVKCHLWSLWSLETLLWRVLRTESIELSVRVVGGIIWITTFTRSFVVWRLSRHVTNITF